MVALPRKKCDGRELNEIVDTWLIPGWGCSCGEKGRCTVGMEWIGRLERRKGLIKPTPAVVEHSP